MQHVFFQQFGMPPQQPQVEVNPIYQYNTIIFEMAANWPFVRWLMDKYRNNLLKKVDPAEQEWFHFILNNKIDVEKYGKNVDLFLEENFKKFE